MRFYYLSIFSLILLGVIYFVGTGLLVWFGAWLRKRWNKAWMVMGPLFLLLYAGPVAEEFWIAWNFGHLCKKDAGIFVYKTVEVEGFFNGTGATLDLVRPGAYQYIEAYSSDGKGAVRLSFGDTEFKRQAIARYEKQFPGKNAAERDMIRVDMDEHTDALVYPKKGDSWRIIKLEHPTARYHFSKPHNHTTVSHKIKMFEYLVEDKTLNEVLAQEKTYARQAPWFFVGLDRPTRFCAVSGDYGEKIHATLYDLVLKPAGRS